MQLGRGKLRHKFMNDLTIPVSVVDSEGAYYMPIILYLFLLILI